MFAIVLFLYIVDVDDRYKRYRLLQIYFL